MGMARLATEERKKEDASHPLFASCVEGRIICLLSAKKHG
jgi:hypothetical protein